MKLVPAERRMKKSVFQKIVTKIDRNLVNSMSTGQLIVHFLWIWLFVFPRVDQFRHSGHTRCWKVRFCAFTISMISWNIFSHDVWYNAVLIYWESSKIKFLLDSDRKDEWANGEWNVVQIGKWENNKEMKVKENILQNWENHDFWALFSKFQRIEYDCLLNFPKKSL